MESTQFETFFFPTKNCNNILFVGFAETHFDPDFKQNQKLRLSISIFILKAVVETSHVGKENPQCAKVSNFGVK